MNKFIKGAVQITGFALKKVALATVVTCKVAVVGMSLFADWAAPRLKTLHEKLK